MQASLREGDAGVGSNRPVIMFSGQGSQKPGMGSDLMALPLICDTFECASDIFGFDVARIALEGPEELLNETRYAQAAILTLSLALARQLQAHEIAPSAVLGFSLGQICALYGAGMLGMEEAFAFASFRASAMERAAREHPGAMCALLGADAAAASRLCEESAQGSILVVANHNCPGQIVISGEKEAIGRAQALWSGQGGKAVVLATSGAFHSPLMSEAAEELRAYCESMSFAAPKIPLICNTDAGPFDENEAPERLAAHLVRPVLFRQSVEALLAEGAASFVELGYGAVLSGFVKRIDKTVIRDSLDTAEKLDAYLSKTQGETHDRD